MYRFLKRIMDLFIAVTALIILSPLFLLIIIALMATGEHTVFYRQERIGYHNRPFQIWKFATMIKNAPNIGNKEITLRKDPRVTRIGRILRITKLNELPQIFNVLSGPMSIVGPRPLMEISNQLYPPDISKLIYSSKPGITGVSSLIFRDEEKLVSEAKSPREMYKAIFPYKASLELWYKQHASLSTDIKIIFLTAWTILFHKSRLAGKLLKGLPKKNIPVSLKDFSDEELKAETPVRITG